MATTSREEILANFQNITAIDDVAEAIMILEEANWDLLTAICRVLPQDEAAGGGSSSGPQMMQTESVGSRSTARRLSETCSISSSDDNYNNLDTAASNNNNVEDSMSNTTSQVRMNIPLGNQPSTSRTRASHRTRNNVHSGSKNNNNGDSMYLDDDDDDDDDYVGYEDESNNRKGGKQLTFNVHFNNRRQQIIMNSQATVGDLRAKIASNFMVPACRQAIRGWSWDNLQKDLQNQRTVLKSLNLGPGEITIELSDLTQEGSMSGIIEGAGSGAGLDVVGRLNETFTLNITLEPDGELLSLKFPGVRTYLDVKNDVFSVTNIADRHQAWTGWPRNITNVTTLAQSGINLVHNLTLRSSFVIQDGGGSSSGLQMESGGYRRSGRTNPFAPTASSSSSRSSSSTNNNNNNNNRTKHYTNHSHRSNSNNANSNNVIEIDSESSVEDFEDASDFHADDDLFAEISQLPIPNNVRHLMPDNVSDEMIGSIQFEQNYTQRYGEPHPEFYKGTLSDALAEACHKPARDRKLLAIYLHHEDSVLSNVFCGQLLSCESIIQSLQENFVLYGWDLTYESNRNMMLSSITSSIGTLASMTVRNIPTSKLPSLIIITKSRSNCEVLRVINGNVSVDDLLSEMMAAIDMYQEQQRIEIQEESDRADREQVLMEQDMAYNASLEADRAKEEAKQRKEQMLANERRRLESEQAEAEAKREAVRVAAEKTLPAEPDGEYKGAVTKIRVRKPGSGQFSERRFTADTKLTILLNYVTSIGFPVDEYKMFSGWPRKDLTTMDLEESLQNLQLCPQETIILEER